MYLLKNGSGSPYDVYKSIRDNGSNIQYSTIVSYFHILRKLGLIEYDHEEGRGEGQLSKNYYTIAKEDDKCWNNPFDCMYPKRKYKKQI